MNLPNAFRPKPVRLELSLLPWMGCQFVKDEPSEILLYWTKHFITFCPRGERWEVKLNLTSHWCNYQISQKKKKKKKSENSKKRKLVQEIVESKKSRVNMHCLTKEGRQLLVQVTTRSFEKWRV